MSKQSKLQWSIDNSTYKLTRDEITMAKCTDEIMGMVKQAFLELIGDDQQLYGDDGIALKMDAGPWNEKVGRNELRAELRQKVEYL